MSYKNTSSLNELLCYNITYTDCVFNGQIKSVLNKIRIKKKNSKLKTSRRLTKALPTYRFIYDNCS